MINVIILGAGGHAKEVYSTIDYTNVSHSFNKYSVVGFYDDATERTNLINFNVFKKIDYIIDKNIKVVLGVGTAQAKSILF